MASAHAHTTFDLTVIRLALLVARKHNIRPFLDKNSTFVNNGETNGDSLKCLTVAYFLTYYMYVSDKAISTTCLKT